MTELRPAELRPLEEEIEELRPGFAPFPTAVFVDDQPWLADHFLPLISIDLGTLSDDLAGTVVTMLTPFEPLVDGTIGETTAEHHNDFTGDNWLAFELTADNRMRFLGVPEYFAPRSDEEQAAAEELRASYEAARASFEATGVVSASGAGPDEPSTIIDLLGGPLWPGNWIDTAEIPAGFELEYVEATAEDEAADDFDEYDWPRPVITRDGRPFFHIASTPAWEWVAQGADAIVLCYEPGSRTVLFSYDWT